MKCTSLPILVRVLTSIDYWKAWFFMLCLSLHARNKQQKFAQEKPLCKPCPFWLSVSRNLNYDYSPILSCLVKVCCTCSLSLRTPIARAKLKQSQLFKHGGIYGIAWWRIAKLKLSNQLECRGIYSLNDVWDIHRYIDIYRSRGTPFDKCGARSSLPQLCVVQPSNYI